MAMERAQTIRPEAATKVARVPLPTIAAEAVVISTPRALQLRGQVGALMEHAEGVIDAARYVAGRHIRVSRRGRETDRIDEALKHTGCERQVATIVGTFSAALALARGSNLIANVPEIYTGNLCSGMFSFPLPLEIPEITIALLWHPRMDADPAHRWLRGCVRDVCPSKRDMRET